MGQAQNHGRVNPVFGIPTIFNFYFQQVFIHFLGEGIVECVPCNKKFNYKSSYKKHCESERHLKKEAIFNGTAVKVDNSKTSKVMKSKKKKTQENSDTEPDDIVDLNYESDDNVIPSDEDSLDTIVEENYTSSLKDDLSETGHIGMKLGIKRESRGR